MSKKPNIIISKQDVERLEKLINGLSYHVLGIDELEEELARANIVESQAIPPTVVTMNSTVQFKTSDSDKLYCLTLVYPKDLDGEGDKISILAPIGSALLGLSIGDEIDWTGPKGQPIKVEIVDIIYQPERQGEYHR